MHGPFQNYEKTTLNKSKGPARSVNASQSATRADQEAKESPPSHAQDRVVTQEPHRRQKTRDTNQKPAQRHYQEPPSAVHTRDATQETSQCRSQDPPLAAQTRDGAQEPPKSRKRRRQSREQPRHVDQQLCSRECQTSDVSTGTNRTSYQERDPVENDEERLAMKRCDMHPPMPKRVANPRIRDDHALHEFYSNSDKMHRATSDDAFTQTWFEYSRSVFPQSARKTDTTVELLNVPTYQCSILFINVGSFNQKSEFRDQRT